MNDLYQSPLYKLFSDEYNNSIYIKRDDLLPFSFGGNKFRIAQTFIDDMRTKKKNCLIGYGSIQSNLTRALANLASKEHIEYSIICPIDDTDPFRMNFNRIITEFLGGHFFFCKKNEIAENIELLINKYTQKGFDPYYIYGNKFGHGNESIPVSAYFLAYKEIFIYERQLNCLFDYIFLPVGTGMTQAGLLCGISKYERDTDVIGISVARTTEQERRIIRNYIDVFRKDNEIKDVSDKKIVVDDSFLCNGYGGYNLEIENTIDMVLRKFGVPLDVTYTGKAFHGMNHYLKNNNIKNKNILFLHTGGTPLFFDYMNKQHSILDKKQVVQYCDFNVVVDYLNKIEKDFPIPLSERVNIHEYAKKVLNKGVVLGIEYAGCLVSASLFYCNDTKHKIAYLTLLGTLCGYHGLGYAQDLLEATIEFCKKMKMDYLCLDVDIKNTKAISLYSKYGFMIEEFGEKIRMNKKIKE